AISESNPRVIDDTRARKLANDLKRCSYYETCATYGLYVERVFQDACQRIVQLRYPSMPAALTSVPSTPNHSQRPYFPHPTSNTPYDTHSNSSQSTSSSGTIVTAVTPNSSTQSINTPQDDKVEFRELPVSTPLSSRKSKKSSIVQKSNSFSGATETRQFSQTTTPILSRKNSKFLKSHFLSPKNKGEEEKKGEGEKLGSGRVILMKQGYLYKKSHGLNKEWKKKYVTLLDDGRLIYHPSLHDYMDDVHGKEIALVHTTVKIPGQRPSGSRTTSSSQDTNGMSAELNNLSIGGKGLREKENVQLTGYDALREHAPSNIDDAFVISNTSVIS
ncbi:hypothetical protein ACJMK2_022301, partial [Sinanodonta woodiana]